MSLSPGSRLGPYEILSPLGAGGMGEVWKARDTRIDRLVALKVLPEDFLEGKEGGERRERFEREAKLLASLNHPNVAVLYSFEEIPGSLSPPSPPRDILVMELLEGESLRGALAEGALPVRKALDVAVQVAEGLAAAHEKTIVHRDLKPENVFLTTDGHVKLLDFGLARHEPGLQHPEDTHSPTISGHTQAGVVVGTVAYMSPEQARGRPVDHRSDQFSFGAVLYEILSGKRPFSGESATETMAAIVRDEPEPLEKAAPKTPAPLRWIVDRLLAKEPAERFESTRDLARDLAACRLHLSETTTGSGVIVPSAPRLRSRRTLLFGALAAVLACTALAGMFVLGRRTAVHPEPRFQRLTFRRGTVWTARFLPDERTVVYSASWEGRPSEVFSVRLDAPESRSLGFPGSDLLAISRTSEMALALDSRLQSTFFRVGTLARVPFSGGAPRPLEERIAFADFSRGSSEVALLRQTDEGLQLEYPPGKAIVRTASGWISEPRISPSGDLVAFLEHPVSTGGDNAGRVSVVDRAGNKRTLTDRYLSAQGLAWAPSGSEIWFTGVKTGARMELRAVTLGGRDRLVHGQSKALQLHDVSADGRALVASADFRSRIFLREEGAPTDRELSWLDNSWATDLSPDGRLVAFTEGGEGAGSAYQVFVRETSGAPAMKLGPGRWSRFSPDGRFVVTPDMDEGTIAVYPVGAGTSKAISLKGFIVRAAGLLPDLKTIWFAGRKPPEGPRFWLTDLSGTPPRPATPVLQAPRHPFASPDGRHVLGTGERGLALYPIAGGEPRPVRGIAESDWIVAIAPDSRTLYVQKTAELRARLLRVDPETGKSVFIRELAPADPAAVFALSAGGMTPDGKTLVYGIGEYLTDLFVVEGLR